MSKIYEALQRAEREQKEGSARMHAEPSRPGRSPEEAWLPRAKDLGVDSPAAAAESTATAPFPSSARNVWSPDFANLPALQKRGAHVEQFRSLRSRLQEMRHKSGLKKILVSSALAQEGKTFVAVNQALVLASTNNQRVLLIDADMRRPTAHTLLGTSRDTGLSDYLGGSASLGDVIKTGKPADESTEFPAALASIAFIPAGSHEEKALNLSGDSQFHQLIASVEEHFDWVIVDSPPVNLVTDGVDLARSCDGVLFVTRSGKSTITTVKRALHNLRAARVLGVVLNGTEDISEEYNSYGY